MEKGTPVRWNLLKRDALYLEKVDKLSRKLKVALFFAHTAARAKQKREQENVALRSLSMDLAENDGFDVEKTVKAAHHCQSRMQLALSETNLNRKAEVLKDALVQLQSVAPKKQ